MKLILTGTIAFMMGGFAYGGIVWIWFSPITISVGLVVALMCGWGGLGAGAQWIQASAWRNRETGRDAAIP